MMTLWKKFKALFSGIEISRPVPRHPAHLWFTLLDLLCILAALIMHGDPRFTVTVAALLIPCALLVYVPYRFCNILMRMILNACIFGAGCFWCMYRLKQGVPMDKMMIEILALWSLTFLTTGASRGYFYLLFIDILMVMYASLLPRLFSLYLCCGAFLTVLIILFRNRTGFLSGDMLLRAPAGSFRRTWHFHLLWLVGAGLIFHFVFGLIPLNDNGLEGLIPVSFNTERESFAPPELKEWLKSGGSVKNSEEGTEARDDAPGDALAPAKTEKGPAAQFPKTPPNVSVVPGDGGGTMGKDLVFRVKSPLKLYHLARLYDDYNGREWRVSPFMRRNRSLDAGSEAHRVKLTYSWEKLFSASLAFPWQAVEFTPDDKGEYGLRYTFHFWGVEILSFRKGPPFNFKAESQLPAITRDEKGAPLPARWPESMRRSAYLRLPRNRISLRVRALAAAVTAGSSTPYAKALALRDYLRRNYTYKLHAERTPRHRESVDYFLFTLGEGHCEYFASALAVLARCAGLPARVATGFSPGNYNTLTSLFEVFEYHAHAWTQIFIPEYGWLTFDATPPSAIVSETTPPGFGKMRDPFGDEWRIRPPELTDNTLDYIQRAKLQAERKKMGESETGKALNDIAAAGEKLREELQKEHRKQADRLKDPALQGKKPLINLTAIRQKAAELLVFLQRKLVDFALFAVSSWTRLLTVTGVALLGLSLLLWAVQLVKRLWRKARFLLLRHRAEQTDRPGRAILNGCHAALLLLELHRMPRENNQELMAYARSLRRDLAPEAEAIFGIFYRAEYRSGDASGAEAEALFRHLQALKNGLEGRKPGDTQS